MRSASGRRRPKSLPRLDDDDEGAAPGAAAEDGAAPGAAAAEELAVGDLVKFFLTLPELRDLPPEELAFLKSVEAVDPPQAHWAEQKHLRQYRNAERRPLAPDPQFFAALQESANPTPTANHLRHGMKHYLTKENVWKKRRHLGNKGRMSQK